jgi:hypothetical protein
MAIHLPFFPHIHIDQWLLKLIKTTTLEQLSKMKDPVLQRNVSKTHPEFKDIWGWIYRGVGFALVSRRDDVVKPDLTTGVSALI